MEKIIDCRGMACPLPVVNAKKATEGLNPGDVLTVQVDNEIAVQNLTRFAEHKGFAVSADKKAEQEYAVIMTVAGGAVEEKEEEIVCAVDARRKGMLVSCPAM
jgi:TusA-related sulfurtransferase